jgi:hypothetical protein
MTIYPLKNNEKFVAKALLDLADNPFDVQVDSRPQQDRGSTVGFRVPIELFERFQETMTTPADVVEEKSQPVKRRAGRPKKEAE